MRNDLRGGERTPPGVRKGRGGMLLQGGNNGAIVGDIVGERRQRRNFPERNQECSQQNKDPDTLARKRFHAFHFFETR